MRQRISLLACILCGALVALWAFGHFTSTAHSDRTGLQAPESSSAGQESQVPTQSAEESIPLRVKGPKAPTATAVLLDDVELRPLAHFRILAEPDGGTAVAMASDASGFLALSPGSWRLMTELSGYRIRNPQLHVGSPIPDTPQPSVVWVTRSRVSRVMVMDRTSRNPVAGVMVTVGEKLRSTKSTALPIFTTDQNGYVVAMADSSTLEDGSHAGERFPSGTTVSISHPDFVLAESTIPWSIETDAEHTHTISIERSEDPPRNITCVDEASTPIAGVHVRAHLSGHPHISSVTLGITDEHGRARLPAWTLGANFLEFSGPTICIASANVEQVCDVYRLRRACMLEFRVANPRPGTAISWQVEGLEGVLIDCDAEPQFDLIRDVGGGTFEARLPREFPMRISCINEGLDEWTAQRTFSSDRERVHVVLTQTQRTRLLTLVPRGGTIASITASTFGGETTLLNFALEAKTTSDACTVLVPTEACLLRVCAESGEVATLRFAAGTKDEAVDVVYRGGRLVHFQVEDGEGRPISDIQLEVAEERGTLPTGEILPKLEIQEMERAASKKGWMQKLFTRQRREVRLTAMGRAALWLPVGLYSVELSTIPWRTSIPSSYAPRAGAKVHVLPGAPELDVLVVADRPRCATLEVRLARNDPLPLSWSLRLSGTRHSIEGRGSSLRFWTHHGPSTWELRSNDSVVTTFELPAGVQPWSGSVQLR